MPALTNSLIARTAAIELSNKLVVANLVNRGWEEEYTKTVNGYKPGATVNVKRPARYTVIDGPTIGAYQASDEVPVPITINRNKIVPMDYSHTDLTLNISEFKERFLDNAINDLVHAIDSDIMSLYNTVPNFVGTPGQVPNGFDPFAAASARMTYESSPTADRHVMIEPLTEASVASQVKSLGVNMSEDAFERGEIGRIASAKAYSTAQVRTHTVGALGGTPVVAGASQTGLVLNISGATASVTNWLRRGDVITVANHFGVNPMNRQPQPYTKTYCVAADVTTTAGGLAAIPLTTPITPTGAFQTVTASPANGAAVTVLTGPANSTFAQNLMFHKNAFAFVCVPQSMVSAPVCELVTYKNISLRLVRSFDTTNGREQCRLEALYGFAAIYPELACRITA